MRDIYQTTITIVDGGVLKPLSNVEISVFAADTTTTVPIYQRRTGATQGPAPETGAASGPNPFVTGSSGAVEFWVPAGVYDIRVRDLTAPARIATRTVQWNSSPSSAGSLPTNLLAADGGLLLTMLGAEILRQAVPIGAVLDWWRPNSSVAVPVGFEICDGRQIATHDFGTAGSINLPDLRNKFIVGADPYKADGTGSSAGDGSAASGAQHPNAPGIGGTGGANAAKDLRHSHQFGHTHGAPDVSHNHSGSTPDHLHGIGGDGGHSHGGIVGGSSQGDAAPWVYGAQAANTFQLNLARGNGHVHGISSDGSHSHGGATGAADRGLGFTTGNQNQSIAHTTNSQSTTTTDNGTAASAADLRPAHYGLLKIMKVRRA